MDATPTTHTCKRCGRKLTSAKAITAGYGATCARKAAIETELSARQVDDAVELVELGGVIPLKGRRVFLTVGHHGETYRTAVTGQCNCPAGLHGRACYHVGAVRLVVASKSTRRVAYPMPPVTYIAAA